MTGHLQDTPPRSREIVRWAACFGLVLAVHGGAALALMAQEETADAYEGNTLNIELAALTEQTAPSNALASGEPQEAVEEQQAVNAEKPEEKIEKVEEEPKETPPTPDPQKLLAPIEPAEVTLPTFAPPPKVEQPQQPVEERERREETARTASLGSPLTPQWRARLATHLQRFKRYPNGSRSTGVTHVEFTLDRKGKLVLTKIVKSSGSDVLDQAAIDMLRRAEPLPPPPAGVDEAQLKMLVPVKFTLPR